MNHEHLLEIRKQTIRNHSLAQILFLLLYLTNILLAHAETRASCETICQQYIVELKEKEQNLGVEHLEIAISLNKLALLYQAQGDYIHVKPLFQRALAIRKKYFGTEHLEIAQSLNHLGVLYLILSDYAHAEPLFQQALAIREKLLGLEHSVVAQSLNHLGWLYQIQGKYDDAKLLHQRALAIQQKVLGAEHPDIAESLNNIGWFHLNKGEYAQAKPLYQRALAIREKAFRIEHPKVAESLNNLGWLYQNQGKYDDAKLFHQRAIAIQEKVLCSEHPEVANSLDNLAKIYQHQGENSQAKQLYQRVLTIREKVFGLENIKVATSLSNLATLYEQLGIYDNAKPFYQRALAIYEKVWGAEHPHVATIINNLATLYQAQGNYTHAEPLYQRALAIYKKILGTEHPQVAISLNNIAVLYKAQGNYAQAEKFYQRALAIWEKTLGSKHHKVATALNNLATLYYELGDYNRSESLYQRAIDIEQENYGLEYPDLATSFNNLAVLYTRLGDYTRAEPLYHHVLDIKNKIYGPQHQSVATVLNNLAALYNDLGNYTEAERIFLAALTIREQIYGSNHPMFALTLNNLAELYINQGHYAHAESLLQRAHIIAIENNEPKLLWNVQHNLSNVLARQNHPNAAIFFGKQAVNTLQSLRKGISEMDKELQQSFVKDKMIVYRHLASLLIDEGRLPEAQQVLAMLKEEEYFDFVRRGTQENAPSTQVIYNNFIEQPWAKRYQEIEQHLTASGYELETLKQKAKLGLSKKEKARRKQLRKDMRIAKKAFKFFFEELREAFKKADPDRAIEFGEKNLKRLKPLQSTLHELGQGVVLVHYLVIENKLHIILTTPDIQLVRNVQVNEKKLNKKIHEFRTNIAVQKEVEYEAEELYDWILAPIVEDLKQIQAKTLMLSLDSTLRYVPIAALYDGEQYIAERYAIVIYTEAGRNLLDKQPITPWTLAGMGLSEAVSGFRPLPNVVTEIESIVRHDMDDQDGVLNGITYLNQDFDADTMLDTLDEGYPVMHIASHFEFKPTNQSSFLLLGNGEQLTLEQIEEEYDFNSLDLLTLSACNTAMGDNANGREVEGFGMLAQSQGAKSVIATLWAVYDKSTAKFMQQFYQKKLSLNKAQALQQVQQWFIQESEYDHPYYWAPFILIGNWL